MKCKATLLLLLLVPGCALNMPGRSLRTPSGPSPAPPELRERLAAHVRMLAETIGERNLRRPDGLDAAAAYLRTTLEEAGYTVQEQTLDAPPVFLSGGRTLAGRAVQNIEARLAAPATENRPDVVVVGAHYDSLFGTPGADDNASGVAALLELARALQGAALPREVRFVFFVNEEEPFFGDDGMGSLAYARRCKESDERIVAMLSLETLGYYSEDEGSQRVPWLLRPFFSDRGDFVAFVSDFGSRKLLRRTVASFREVAEVPSRGAALPRSIEGVDWSDHWSFWEVGYPALMVTDTAFLRNPNYHQASDTPETLDLDRLASVVVGLTATVRELADEPSSKDR